MDTSNVTRESQYNLNESTTLLIGDLQREALQLSNSFNYPRALEKWNSIRILIEARFDEKEVDALDKLYKDFYNIKPAIVPINLKSSFDMMTGLNSKQRFQIQYLMSNQKKRLHDFVRELMILMREYKISTTDKEKKTRLS